MASKNSTSLYRSEENKVVAGICGGFGEYLGIDPVILRIIIVLMAVFGGGGVIIYLILWIVIPSKSQSNKKSEEYIKENVEDIKTKSENLAKNGNGRVFGGILLVILGLVFLSENLGFYVFHNACKFWPVALIALGISVLANNTKK